MVYFPKLEDSPMFRDQVNLLERNTQELKDRCRKFYKGCRQFTTVLSETCHGDHAFADCLQTFSGGPDDLMGVAIGGPVMSKYIGTFRELGSYKELLSSQYQNLVSFTFGCADSPIAFVTHEIIDGLLCPWNEVEHMLTDRLLQFMNTDIQDIKDSRQRFDKATASYDQALEKLMSLKKSTRPDIVQEVEEDLHNSRSAFEKCRFNLITALANIESKKKFEFLESLSGIMDAHLRYFKQGYELLHQMEPFIHQVLTYAQQSKDMALSEQDDLAKRIQEFRTHAELENLQSDMVPSTSGDGIHVIGSSSYRTIEALMQATAHGKVQTIKQGYLLKRSANSRSDWKRRYFVLDSHGTLYYYRTQSSKTLGPPNAPDGSMFGRFMPSRPKALPNDENLGCRTVDLLTSTIKIDAEQTDLRFCFRIISPLKTYTLQAVNGSDRTDWVDKITGVIASLLNASVPMEHGLGAKSSVVDSLPNDANSDGNITLQDHKVARVLREVPGNNVCAECGAPEPDWASLNLGVLLCIECSGVHRNLGVHISKVRSLKLDVKVWDPIVVDLFQHLGNKFCNSIWEGLLQIDQKRENEMDINLPLVIKPVPSDALLKKEMYIQSKYVERCLIKKEDDFASRSIALLIWNAVESKNIQELYSLLVVPEASANTIYDQAYVNDLFHPANTKLNSYHEKKTHDPSLCQSLEDSDGERVCRQGCSLLHLSCHVGELATAELLLQFGADINAQDFHGRTPLHHCILTKNNQFAKYLMRRGANSSIKDAGGQSALERTMELGAITDEELLILLTND